MNEEDKAEKKPEEEGPEPKESPEGNEAPEGGAHKEPGIHVDEDWKAQAARDKERLRQKEQEKAETRREEVRDRTLPPADFNSLVASFATQALVQLGQVESPLTGKQEFDPDGARYTIGLLDMLKQKTKGNLEPDEERQLDAILYDLKMRFVQAQQQPPSAGPEAKPQA